MCHWERHNLQCLWESRTINKLIEANSYVWRRTAVTTSEPNFLNIRAILNILRVELPYQPLKNNSNQTKVRRLPS